MSTTTQNKTLHNKIRKLAPDAIETMGEMLRDPKTPGPTKAQLIGFILERTLGKPDTTIHLMTEGGTVKDAENRLIAIAEEIREETAKDAEESEESGDDSEDDEEKDDDENDDGDSEDDDNEDGEEEDDDEE